MDLQAESSLAMLKQFKRDRWPYAIGHVGATLALVCIAWSVADHSALLWFGLVHHVASWIAALTLYLPLRGENTKRIPFWTYFGVVLVNATLSSALLFDLTAAQDLTFVLVVGVVLFAGAAGSFVTLGVHPTILRVALTSLLLPFVITTLCLGYVAVALGTVFFFCNVVVAGVWKLTSGQQELISLRLDAAQRAEIAELEAETDHLTGLVNRRGLKRFDGMELSNGAAALYFDVNKFKSINDTYGHLVGDEILQVVSQRLRGAVAATDVVVRLGGDEFLVLIFSDQDSTIDAAIERLSQRLQEPVSVSSGLMLNISAAVGHSSTSEPVLILDDLLRDSDQAMYQSKGSFERTPEPDFALQNTFPTIELNTDSTTGSASRS